MNVLEAKGHNRFGVEVVLEYLNLVNIVEPVCQ